MARHTFPGDVFLQEASGNLVALAADVPFRVYSARTGGVEITASMTLTDGTTLLPSDASGALLADSNGLRPWMMGPDTLSGSEVAIIYIDAGGGDRYPVYAVDLLLTVLLGGGGGSGGGGGIIEDPLDPGFFVSTQIATLVINAQTGTTYTLALSDASKLITLTNASGITLTVPTNTSVAFPVGVQITLTQLGAGQVTVAGAVGVTVNGAPGLKLTDQYSTATLIKSATDTWLLVGRLSA